VALLAWPAGLPMPQQADFQLWTRVGVLTSPIAGTEVTQERQGARWKCTLQWDLLENAEWQLLQGLLAALADTANTLAVPDPAYAYLGRRGGLTGTPAATGAADAKIVSLTGVAGTDPVLRYGDRLQIGTRLHVVTGDVTKSGTTASVPIQPPLRATVAALAIGYVAPTCEMRLLDGDQAKGSFRPPAIGAFKPSFIEPLP
jgi:hypothetical protein